MCSAQTFPRKEKGKKMPSDIQLAQLHKTCYAGASWEMSMQYPFMMAIKRSEPWWASSLEDDVIPHYYSPHLSLRQLCLPCVRQRRGLVSVAVHVCSRLMSTSPSAATCPLQVSKQPIHMETYWIKVSTKGWDVNGCRQVVRVSSVCPDGHK